MAKKKDEYTALTPQDIATANAMGMTPAEYEAAYATVGARQAVSGRNPVAQENAQLPLQGPGIPGQPGEGYVVGTAFPHKGGGAKPADPKETLAQAEDQAINQMYQGLLGQFTAAENVVNPYISGANAGQAAQTAQGIGSKLAGGGVQGPDAGIAAMLSKDAQAYGAANQAGQAGVAAAIGGMSKANQAATNVSPYGQLLSALANKAQYNIVYGGAQPNVSAAPNYVQEALNAANQLQVGGAGLGGATTVGTPQAPAPATTASGSAVPATGTYQSATGG
jgi:hypothetical protein